MIQRAVINGKIFEYDDTLTVFKVQSARGRDKYETRYTFRGDLKQAIFYYRCINCDDKHKKRIMVEYTNGGKTRRLI